MVMLLGLRLAALWLTPLPVFADFTCAFAPAVAPHPGTEMHVVVEQEKVASPTVG